MLVVLMVVAWVKRGEEGGLQRGWLSSYFNLIAAHANVEGIAACCPLVMSLRLQALQVVFVVVVVLVIVFAAALSCSWHLYFLLFCHSFLLPQGVCVMPALLHMRAGTSVSVCVCVCVRAAQNEVIFWRRHRHFSLDDDDGNE